MKRKKGNENENEKKKLIMSPHLGQTNLNLNRDLNIILLKTVECFFLFFSFSNKIGADQDSLFLLRFTTVLVIVTLSISENISMLTSFVSFIFFFIVNLAANTKKKMKTTTTSENYFTNNKKIHIN